GVLAGPIVIWVTTIAFLRWRYKLHAPLPLRLLTTVTIAVIAATGILGATVPAFSPETVVLKGATYAVVVFAGWRMMLPSERQQLATRWRRATRVRAGTIAS